MNFEDYNGAMKSGAKILPHNIAGLIGLPYVGKVFYVDPSGGNDTTNSGTSQNDALATVSAAFAKCTSGHHDVVIIAPTGGTGRATETTAITWNKRFTHLIGSAAPTAQDARAGISFGTGGSLTISENGCVFKSLTFNGTADINVPVTITGHYNAFIGVDFKGSLNADTGDDAAGRALYINGGQENTFAGCTFGADTFNRSTTNATVEFASAASRNVFDSCRFIMAADNVGPNHILLTGTSAIDRWLEFKDCSFYSFWANDADKVTHVIDASAQTATGHILMTGMNTMIGFDDWEASDSGKVWFQGYTNTSNVIGIAINPAVS
jgi:hypothetical protein